MKPLWLAAAALILAALIWRFRRLSNLHRVVALIVAAALAVYGLGLVHLPDVEQVIEDIGSTLGRWTYLLVGGMTFLETGAFVGFIAPGEFTILLGGVVAGQGEINVVVLIGIVWACAVLGDTTSFFLGRRLGRGFLLRHGARFKITEERLRWVEGFYERHGTSTVLIGRFVGLLRALGPFIAGASKMPYRRFLPPDIIGGGVWGTLLVLIGYVFWHSFDTLKTIVGQGAIALGATIVVIAGAIVAFRYFRVAENRAEARAWLDERAARSGIEGVLARAARTTWQRAVTPLGQILARPARFIWERVTPGPLGLELTALLAIALVGSFLWIGTALLLDDATYVEIDQEAFGVVSDARRHAVAEVVKVVTYVASLPVTVLAIALASGFLLGRKRVAEATTLMVGMVLTFAAVHITKALEDRPRPPGALVEAAGSSYPSGHAAYSIAYVAIAVAILHAVPGVYRRTLLLTVAIVLAAVGGLSRVYLRAHYLSDVIGGWGLALTVFSVCGMVAVIASYTRASSRRRGSAPVASN